MTGENLLGVPPTLLNPEPGSIEVLSSHPDGSSPSQVELELLVQRFPTSSLVWALLSDRAFEAGQIIPSYAFARVGYHRGLDALRKGGWRGQGPVPWSHEPNRGVLRALYALRRAAEQIGETDEVTRLTEFLIGADATVIQTIETAHYRAAASTEGL
ncbi:MULTISPECIES: DUF3151 domain-containing protein [Subtercola]|uniref:DUF3151 domain-containing protein n=1 Tax=Subtercola vilae TaxID=2056433 RepID=A0A4T2C316_9MICO|nr:MULTISPECIES: DUF3151 domain-containing protein [Subtercola]MEA9987262.1 DUF3151 domain-containing protein [Subtercola sp. RTI3]TIH38723.1 DUF3151 domain-containing protein [Subtercola vilae]